MSPVSYTGVKIWKNGKFPYRPDQNFVKNFKKPKKNLWKILEKVLKMPPITINAVISAWKNGNGGNEEKNSFGKYGKLIKKALSTFLY